MPATSRKTAYTAVAVSILSFFAATTEAHRHAGLQPLSRHARLNTKRASGNCYSSNLGLTDSEGTAIYQSSGNCTPLCKNKGYAVAATSGGSYCSCGNVLPPADSQVDDGSCDSPCDGYDKEMCGGDGFYSVYLTGTDANVGNYQGSDSSSDSSSGSGSSQTSSAAPSTTQKTKQAPTPRPDNTPAATVVTSVLPGQTIIQTYSPAASSSGNASGDSKSDHKSGSGTNTAGIAAGVVVGVVALAAIIGGAVFFMKRRKRLQAEEENRRANEVTQFMRQRNDPKPPNSAYSNTSDSRLDPEAGAKRNSVGSIADDQDFSRRILRVANPDGH